MQIFCSRHLENDKIKECFKNKDFRSIDTIAGKLDNISYHSLYKPKDPNYDIMMMATYATLDGHNEGQAK